MTELSHEKKAIEQTLQLFFDGLDNLDAELILQAFHYKSWSFHMDDGNLATTPVSHWPKTIEDAKSNPDHPFAKEKSKKKIVYIDITGDSAQAKVEWVFTDFMFTDYYNMLKIDGRWLIVNKTYHTTKFSK